MFCAYYSDAKVTLNTVQSEKRKLTRQDVRDVGILLLAVALGSLGAVALVGLGLQAFNNSITAVSLDYNYTALLVVASLVFVDILSRQSAYRGLLSVQSVSLDIVIFSLGYRVAVMLQDFFRHGAAPSFFLPFVNHIVLAVLIAGDLALARWIYRERFVQEYRTKLRDTLAGSINMKKSLSPKEHNRRQVIIDICVSYKHPDLWGLFKRNLSVVSAVVRDKDEFADITKLVTTLWSESAGLDPETTKLALGYRAYLALVLAAASVFAFVVNGVVLGPR